MISGEEKEFVEQIIRKFGGNENLDSNQIGNGHTGSVWKISDELCLKVSTEESKINIPESFKNCKNLCVPLESFRSKSGKYVGVIQRYLNFCSLQQPIKDEITIPEKLAASIFFDILNGLKVIHENGYVHRDFYPGNVMLTKNNGKITAVIIDFDEMQPISSETKACFQYSGYQAPEIVFGNDTYDDKSEIFALGVTFWELLKGKCPFGGYDFFGSVIETSWKEYEKNNDFYNDRVKNALKMLPDNLKKIDGISDECANLMCSLLSYNKDKRISAHEAIEHPFFKRFLEKEYDLNKKCMTDIERD